MKQIDEIKKKIKKVKTGEGSGQATVTGIKGKIDLCNAKIHPIVSSAHILCDMHKDNKFSIRDVIENMQLQIQDFQSNGTQFIEEALFGQAMALQAIFQKSAAYLAYTDNIECLQAWSAIAFKAQNQCRQTFTALAELKNPKKTSFIKQQNNALNQQVNNYSELSVKFTEKENELLEEKHDSLDARTKITPITAYSEMAALEAINRATDK